MKEQGERAVSYEEGEMAANGNPYFEVSTETGENMEKLFRAILLCYLDPTTPGCYDSEEGNKLLAKLTGLPQDELDPFFRNFQGKFRVHFENWGLVGWLVVLKELVITGRALVTSDTPEHYVRLFALNEEGLFRRIVREYLSSFLNNKMDLSQPFIYFQ
eukprot:TRINITY_DN9496_c0_g1_i1.p1 TRINITY_DN9496_c0_g1~~TRINITY_DN9496_c0_g1_i1.p1  ORF type:complete len:159 (-),score=42.54 TRINITY_DN9496_c0_g1_i1:34-510(-)